MKMIKRSIILCFVLLLFVNTCSAYQNINVNSMWETINEVFRDNSKNLKHGGVTEEVRILSLDKSLYEYNVIRNYPNALQATHCYASYFPVSFPNGSVLPAGNDLWLLCNENNDVRQLMFHVVYLSDTESYKDGYIVKSRRNANPYLNANQVIQCMLISFGVNDRATLGKVMSICEKAYNSNNIDTVDTIVTPTGECYTCVIHKGVNALTSNCLSVSVSMPANI
jgi:hypothetical protein